MLTGKHEEESMSEFDPQNEIARKGGIARAAKLTSTERSEIAREAAAARWGAGTEDGVPRAIFGAADRPLKIAGEEIPCYVIENGDEPMRVLVMTGILSALNISLGGSRQGLPGNRLYRFVASQSLAPFASAELLEKLNNPILFRTPSGAMASGYEAFLLADICDAVLLAKQIGTLNRQQKHIAEKCQILVNGWARAGLIGLIDEATGFQYYRARNALEAVLDRYIGKELLKWQKTFPDEFYAEMFRLRRWMYEPQSSKRPGVIGGLTNDVVYARLAPGVLEELQRLTPKDARGRRTHKYFQRLTEDVGHPKLREHLIAVIALMRASETWDGFYRLVQRAFPRINTNLYLALPETDH